MQAASIAEQLGRFNEAIALMLEAGTPIQDGANYFMELGLLYEKAERLADAADAYRSALGAATDTTEEYKAFISRQLYRLSL